MSPEVRERVLRHYGGKAAFYGSVWDRWHELGCPPIEHPADLTRVGLPPEAWWPLLQIQNGLAPRGAQHLPGEFEGDLRRARILFIGMNAHLNVRERYHPTALWPPDEALRYFERRPVACIADGVPRIWLTEDQCGEAIPYYRSVHALLEQVGLTMADAAFTELITEKTVGQSDLDLWAKEFRARWRALEADSLARIRMMLQEMPALKAIVLQSGPTLRALWTPLTGDRQVPQAALDHAYRHPEPILIPGTNRRVLVYSSTLLTSHKGLHRVPGCGGDLNRIIERLARSLQRGFDLLDQDGAAD